MGKLSIDFLTTMHTTIFLFQLLFIPFALPESYEPTVSDLTCFNDYDTEMKCHMISDKLHCTEYKLNVSHNTYKQQTYSCSFERFPPKACECKFQVPGFVLTENFTAILYRGEDLVFTKNINTDESIKPKRPTIVSVKLTENGNFRITWDTNYTSPLQKPFSDSLMTELTYGIKGSKNMSKHLLQGSHYEIVSRNLQPNSKYVVRVRTQFNNNSILSDYSQPYEFITPISTETVLKILIPILCIILIIFMSTTFCYYNKMKRELWDTYPTPKITSSFKSQIDILLPFENEFSPIHVEKSSLGLTGNKTWSSSFQADVNREHHNRQSIRSVRQDKVTVNAAVSKLETSMSYNTLENQSRATVTVNSTCGTEQDSENSTGLLSFSNKCYFDAAFSLLTQPSDSCKKENSLPASTNLAPISVCNKVHNNVLSDGANTEIQRQSGNNSDSSLSNRCLLESHSDSSSFLHQSIKNDNLFPALSENVDPVMQTDLDYGPCSGPADANSTQSTPFRTEIVVVHGYQSVNELLDHGNKPEADASVNQAFISFHNDVNLIMEKPICCKKPQDVAVPACESIIIPADDGYQSLPSLDQNTWSSDRSTELEQNIPQAVAQTAHHNMSCVSQQEHAPSFKSLCGPVLNISPGIQIDCSYRKV
ncbi:uncharacterized protein LOC118805753 isoform X2 [Colossoma macropomum]|uniref:uncharacterized protein LOC118805753 isoform X2 n=1 Tax=Colossoma macropomum TaxID=42526 RepID=UPI001863EF57|nr:uncharacterized protein LOC118805753 isoform X2 [Colossoma macropomum]